MSPIMMAAMVMQAGSAYANSKGTKHAYSAQAQVSANNAQIADWRAEDALRRGARTASAVRLHNRRLKGAQRATMAANGVDLGEGSALQILSDTDYFGELDALTASDNAAREAWALRNQAAGFRNESALLKSRADAEKPWLAAATSLLTSASKVAPHWYSPGGSVRGAPTYPGAEY